MILFPASFHCLRQPRFLLEQRQKTRGCLARSDVASPLGGLGLGKFGTNTPHSRGRAFPSARVVGKHSPRTASAAICTLSVIAPRRMGACSIPRTTLLFGSGTR